MTRTAGLAACLMLALAGCTTLPDTRTAHAPAGGTPQWAATYTGSCDVLEQAGEVRKSCDPLLFASAFPSGVRNFVVQTADGLVVGFRTKPTEVSQRHHEVAEVVIDRYPPLPALGHCDFVMAEETKGSLFCECYAGGKSYRAHFRIMGVKQMAGSPPH